MQRRTAIRNIAIISGGLLFWPSCKNTPSKASLSFKNIIINEKQEKLLAEIASTIIPATNTLGAKEVGAHLFALKMLDDLYEKEVQQNFITGLGNLEKYTKMAHNKSFLDCTIQQRQEVLQYIEIKKVNFKDAFDFYTIMKQRTVEGYLNSKYVMTKIIKYEFIPSQKYDGFYPVKNV